MAVLFVLRHLYILEGRREIKDLGFFESRAKAEDLVPFLKLKPGFIDYPGKFEVVGLKIDEIFFDDLHTIPVGKLPL